MYSQYNDMTVELLNYLSSAALFENCVYENATFKNSRNGDVIAYNRSNGNPVALFDIKLRKSSRNVEKTITEFRKTVGKYGPEMKYYIVYPGDDVWPFHMYEITDYVFDSTIEYNDADFGARHVAIPLRGLIVPGKTKKEHKKTGLSIVCWVIIPLLLALFMYLDVSGLVPLSKERIILYVSLLISIILPFYDVITYKDLMLKHKNETANKSSDENECTREKK